MQLDMLQHAPCYRPDRIDFVQREPYAEAFGALWALFVEAFEAAEAINDRHNHTGRGYDEDCPACHSTLSTFANARSARLKRSSELCDALDRASRLYQSTRTPPPPGARFYVSAVRGEHFALVAGPYATHEEALDVLPAAKRLAHTVDRRSVFDAFGTCNLAPDGSPFPEGVLNAQLNARKETPAHAVP